MSKIAVIGGGASGMVAAIQASINNEVILLESNDKCGKKLLITGNGRCNYWNSDINIKNYNTDSKEDLETILKNKEEVLHFLETIGLYPKIKNGYYYPYSSTAASVRELLVNTMNECGVKVITNQKVKSIKKEDNVFKITSNDTEYVVDKVILATGSSACPKTGSDGDSYSFVKEFNHKVNSVLPALASLKGNEKYFKEWEGIRTDATVTLYKDNKPLVSETGEIQLTDYGISGICVFNISGLVAKELNQKNRPVVKIDFLPDISNLREWFDKRNELVKGTLVKQLESIFNYKLLYVLLKEAGLNKENLKWTDLSEEEKSNLIETIKEFSLEITETSSLDKAQVCTGGVPLEEIDINTMESKKENGLYLTGELLDVDGKCGGFNLAFAFITGYLAGRGIK